MFSSLFSVIPRFTRFSCRGIHLLLLTSVVSVLVFNRTFLGLFFAGVTIDSIHSFIFAASVPLFMIIVYTLLTSLFSLLVGVRLAVMINFMFAALVSYATASFGIVFDKEMLRNIFETNSLEALSYLNVTVVVYAALAVILPVVLMSRMRFSDTFKQRLVSLLSVNAVGMLGVIVIAAVFYKDYASFFRNHKELTKYITPVAAYDSTYKYVRDTYFTKPTPFHILDPAPRLNSYVAGSSTLTVMVVGETARADHFQLQGYPRETTPNLDREHVLYFSAVTSCGTATAVSVPCMFSRLNREEYDHFTADHQDNALDIIQRAGVEVTWIDNNSSCKGVCKRVPSFTIEPNGGAGECQQSTCFDSVLVTAVKQYIAQSTRRNKLLVLHMIGSHGPTYYQRYPKNFRRFTPDCQQSDIQNCTNEALINTYDNTIAYTDYVLGEIIETLKHSGIDNTQMLYVSDHGESLGESGLYLHGFPYAIAPESQTHVPMLYWQNLQSDYAGISRGCDSEFVARKISHDNIFDMLMGMTGVETIAYRQENNVFSQCDQSVAGISSDYPVAAAP
jgi:lipid A ethanolaminephosphotransferase